jgi:hypothetical protein
MNIDQVISDADPAAHIAIPGPDSTLARQSLERMSRDRRDRRLGRRRRFTAPIAIGAVTAAAAAITMITSITPGVPVSSASAAVVLRQAAAAAERQKPLVLRHGEYLYTEIRALSDGTVVKNHHVFYPEYVYTDRSWLTARGAGEDIMTVRSPVTFGDHSRAAWIAAGRPRLFAHDPDKPFVSRYSAPKPGGGPGQPGGTGVPLENLSHLPTNPAALSQAITQRKTGLAGINADVDDPSTPAGTFYAAMDILSSQSVGGTPALRSALFKVMAEQPGIKLIGHTTTRSGRAGTGLVTPPNHGVAFKVIIDVASGQVLESDTYVHGVADQWTEYLSTAVVSKIGQAPHAS